MRLCPCIGYVSLTLGEVGGVHEQRDYKVSTSNRMSRISSKRIGANAKQSVPSATVQRTDKIGGSRLSKAMVGGFGKHRESDAWFFREGK